MVYMRVDLIAWLIAQLDERGWSQSELARRAEVSQSTISDVISEKRNPTWDFCAAVARALQVPVDEVFVLAGLKPAPPPPVEEEGEAVEILRSLSSVTRVAAVAMLRGLARDEGIAVPERIAEAAQGHQYDEQVAEELRAIAEGLTRIAPETRDKLTRQYLSLLEFAEAAEAVGQERRTEEERD